MKKFFVNLSIKIFNYIYYLQNKKHEKRMEKLKSHVLSGSICDEKYHTTSSATLTIKNNSKEEKRANRQKIENIINRCLDKPEKFFEYIQGAKTPVYKIKKAKEILALINEQEGFIYPKKGLCALYLNLILNKKISFKTPEMFVLSSFCVNPYAISYQFYNWYCYKLGLKGYEDDTQEKFKNVFEYCEKDKIDTLSYSEILGLKSAIRRDIEAIEFVQKLAKNKYMARKNLEKIKQKKIVRI